MPDDASPNSGGQQYKPDIIVIDADTTHWVVEAKVDMEMSSDDVKAKRDAARRWANYVNADPDVDVSWRYLLILCGQTERSAQLVGKHASP